ncbi:HDOD domain-containing signal-transduction protein [Campylobacter iguaniorum]|uniref:HDOD domain-containing signal-transduction protein n=1 Tax=Campylobacter iguaniorum TaxID=1244531 RepID=A0A076FC52_9BACT|nr:HDOD domain-containing protein [Campylobacter iguaniorum]AII15007.1 HDOD domain-containing signal-transduction protein [Campylobacter iguaniorum]ALV24835.1 HDOD domain-containing signal-transduction protein [Campylobacter iguaniorum]
MNQAIYKSIKTLPPLDDTIIKIQQICSDPNGQMSDLVNIIQKDPMLTANILRSANSPLYGFSREITDVNRAVMLFGIATIRGFALSGAIKKTFSMDLKPYGITNEEFMQIASMQNALIFNWYSKVDRDLLKILAPASFMMEVGKIIIAKELIENDKTPFFQDKLKHINTPADLSDLEVDMVGISNEDVTAKIFEQWNLETEMIDAIFYSNNPDDAPDHIKPCAIALKIVKNAINTFGKLTDENLQNTLALLDTYGFEQAAFIEAVKKVKG